ncbi:MAG: hypothetical protein ABFS10_06040 [Bacteroidota bacterium]
MKKRFDTVLSGLIPGLILPVVTLVVILMVTWLIRYDGEPGEFFTSYQSMQIFSKVLSLATIPNLLLFFLFIWTNRIYSARGVIFATLVVAMVMLVLKFA